MANFTPPRRLTDDEILIFQGVVSRHRAEAMKKIPKEPIRLEPALYEPDPIKAVIMPRPTYYCQFCTSAIPWKFIEAHNAVCARLFKRPDQ